MLSGDGNKNSAKKNQLVQLAKKKKKLWTGSTLFLYISCHFFTRLERETSRNVLVTRFMEEMLYSFLDPVHFFFYATHQFTLVATGGTSHFHTAAIKFSCYSSKVIGLLCLLSLALALSVINIDILRSFISIDDGNGSETSVLKWIPVFSIFVAFIPICWKWQV